MTYLRILVIFEQQVSNFALKSTRYCDTLANSMRNAADYKVLRLKDSK